MRREFRIPRGASGSPPLPYTPSGEAAFYRREVRGHRDTGSRRVPAHGVFTGDNIFPCQKA